MAKIRWSNLAMEDLQDIYNHVSKDSTRYADRLMDKIIERVDILRSHPQIGRNVPEFDNESIRELIESNYRIIYRLESKEEIGIVRIYHGARLLKGL